MMESGKIKTALIALLTY